MKTPASVADLIKRMGSAEPQVRPSALELVRALEATGLARLPSLEGGCCSLS